MPGSDTERGSERAHNHYDACRESWGMGPHTVERLLKLTARRGPQVAMRTPGNVVNKRPGNVDGASGIVYPFCDAMGLFDLLSKEGRKQGALKKNLARSLNKHAQSADRMHALELLNEDGSDEALLGL